MGSPLTPHYLTPGCPLKLQKLSITSEILASLPHLPLNNAHRVFLRSTYTRWGEEKFSQC